MSQELLLTGMVSFVTSYGYLSQTDPSGQFNLAVAVVVSIAASVSLHLLLDRTIFRNCAEPYKQKMPE